MLTALNLLRFFLHAKDLKAFHRIIKTTDMIPEMPNYENFLKATNKSFPIIALFMQTLLLQNRLENENACILSIILLSLHALTGGFSATKLHPSSLHD
ncbi:MAG: hypothetical protein IJM48_02280 [Treponema sp.]|nr:hypothetical protein [Treponema sp.]